MRVRIVVPTYYPATAYGGPTFSIHNTAQAMARAGMNIDVSTTDADRPNRLAVSTDKPVSFEPRYLVRYYRENITDRLSLAFIRGIKSDLASADVVHLQDVFSSYALVTLWHARRLKKPVIVSPRGVFSAWALAAGRSFVKSFWIEFLFKPLAGRITDLAWHVTSEQEGIDTKARFKNADVAVIPNGVDLAAFADVAPLNRADWLQNFVPQLDLSERTPLLLVAMGRIHPVKGFDIALKALRALVDKGLDCLFVIAGKDEGARADLEAQARSLGLADRLFFSGELLDEAKIRFLAGGDVFLFPSHSENFGLACLESLAAGTPVVASRDTPWQMLERYTAGKWIENQPEAIVAAVEAIREDTQTPWRQNAKALASQFGYPKVAEAFSALFARMERQT